MAGRPHALALDHPHIVTIYDIAEVEGQHFIVMQYVGAGKVLFHATDETWRWRWRAGDVFFARYWVQMLRYLCRSKLTEGGAATLTTDQPEYQRGESVRLRVRFADQRKAPAEEDGVTVVVEQQGRQTQRLQLHRTAAGGGTFEGLLTRPAAGTPLALRISLSFFRPGAPIGL